MVGSWGKGSFSASNLKIHGKCLPKLKLLSASAQAVHAKTKMPFHAGQAGKPTRQLLKTRWTPGSVHRHC